jgi:glutathione S-transferase/GST-like protein
MRFFDAYFGPSLSMIGWSVFVGPAARQRDPEELRAAIDRIPLEARRIAWRKALFNEFTEAELAESRRRVVWATGVLESHLATHEWIAGGAFSLGDISGFNLGYALPLSQPAVCNDEKTPHIMEWLRRIYERPATRQTWAKGRTSLASRAAMLERKLPSGGP